MIIITIKSIISLLFLFGDGDGDDNDTCVLPFSNLSTTSLDFVLDSIIF